MNLQGHQKVSLMNINLNTTKSLDNLKKLDKSLQNNKEFLTDLKNEVKRNGPWGNLPNWFNEHLMEEGKHKKRKNFHQNSTFYRMNNNFDNLRDNLRDKERDKSPQLDSVKKMLFLKEKNNAISELNKSRQQRSNDSLQRAKSRDSLCRTHYSSFYNQ